MHISHRKERILSELTKRDAYVTSAQLAQSVGVSARTIREDLKDLTADLAERNVTLHAVPSKGYRIDRVDWPAAGQYLTELTRDRCHKPNLPVERQHYILQELLFGAQRVDPMRLADSLYVSRSTVEKDLQEVSDWLQKNNLSLEKDAGSTFRIEGAEIALRYAMVHFYLEGMGGGPLDLRDLGSHLQADFIEDIERELRELHALDSVQLSHTAFSNLLVYLAVSVSRLAMGHQATIAPEEIPALASQKEFIIALDCLRAIEKAAGFSFPDSEVMQFSKALMQANIIAVDQTNLRAIADDRTLAFVNKAVFKIQTDFKLDLTGDRKFINSLVLYLRSKRLEDGQRISPSALKVSEIEREYPQAFEITLSISGDLKEELGIRLNDAEVGELALFICAAIERQRGSVVERRIRVAIICGAGKGGSQLLSAKIERAFRDLDILGVFPSYRLAEVQAMHPDLIFSTIPLDGQDIHTLQINPLMTERDQAAIQSRINALKAQSQIGDQQILFDLLDSELFFPGMDLHSPEAVIEWMGAQLQNAGYVEQDFVQSVLAREALYPTSIGNLVAIPHAFLQNTKRPCISVASLKEPIQWGAEKAQLVLMLNISTAQEADFKPIFSQLYRLLNDRRKVQRLIKTTHFAAFMKALNE